MALKSEGQEWLADFGSFSPFDNVVKGLLLNRYLMMAPVAPFPVLSTDLQHSHIKTIPVLLHSGLDHSDNQRTRWLPLATPALPVTSHRQV